MLRMIEEFLGVMKNKNNQPNVFMPLRSKSVFCFCSVCYSEILSFCNSLWIFYLANNFWTVSTRALTFHMSLLSDNTFPGVQSFLPCDLYLGVWPTFWKLNLVYNLWTVSARALIFHMCICSDKILGTNIFYLVSLILE